MKCIKHAEMEAHGICINCGKPFCADCLVDIQNKNYCRDCISDHLASMQKSFHPLFPQQQQQQQQSGGFLDGGYLDYSNIHLVLIAFGLFFLGVFLLGYSSGSNLIVTGIGFALLLASLVLGLYYAINLTKGKKSDPEILTVNKK